MPGVTFHLAWSNIYSKCLDENFYLGNFHLAWSNIYSKCLDENFHLGNFHLAWSNIYSKCLDENFHVANFHLVKQVILNALLDVNNVTSIPKTKELHHNYLVIKDSTVSARSLNLLKDKTNLQMSP